MVQDNCWPWRKYGLRLAAIWHWNEITVARLERCVLYAKEVIGPRLGNQFVDPGVAALKQHSTHSPSDN